MKKKNYFINNVKITPTRHKIIAACVLHKQRKGLGEFIGMKQHTVDAHLKLLYAKFEVHTMAEFILVALTNGYSTAGKWIKIIFLFLQLTDYGFVDLDL